jgi:hypothetical protein
MTSPKSETLHAKGGGATRFRTLTENAQGLDEHRCQTVQAGASVRQRQARRGPRSNRGKFKTQFKSAEDAMAAGMKLKEKYPVIRVEIFNAVERNYAPVEFGKGAVSLASE